MLVANIKKRKATKTSEKTWITQGRNDPDSMQVGLSNKPHWSQTPNGGLSGDRLFSCALAFRSN